MTKNKVLQLVAGTAVASGSIAFAQDVDLDRAYAAALNADADARTSEVLGSTDSGGFTIVGDGDNKLNIGALMQFRYTANFRDDDATGVASDDEFTHGYSWNRARIDFTGSVLTEDLTFRLSGDFGEINSSENDLQLTYAFGQYALSDSLEGGYIRFGIFKLPIFAEELIEAEYLQAADRSATNEYFSQQYSEGIMFGYDADSWRGSFAVSDGINTAGTSFNSTAEADVALTGRVDFKFGGDWTQFNDLTSFRGSENAFKVGAAIHWQTFGDTNPSNAFAQAGIFNNFTEGDALLYTADIQYESNGWNIFASFLGSWIDGTLTGATGDQDFSDFGVVVQAGYFLTPQYEVFARYDGLFIDDDRLSGGDDEEFNFLTVGVNYYIIEGSHAAKATLDVVFAFDETNTLPGGFNQDVTGLLGQDEDPEVAIRAQVQLFF